MLKLSKFTSCIRNVLSTRIFSRHYSVQVFKPFYESFLENANNISVIDRLGRYKYRDVLYTGFLIAKKIENIIPNGFETNERISFLCPNEAIYVSVMLACWISGNIAVPLSSSHPKTLLEFVIKNSESNVIICTDSLSNKVQDIASNLNINYFTVNSIIEDPSESYNSFCNSKFFAWDSSFSDRKALIIYTSGTTGVPKGVVLTHGNLFAQVTSLVKAWDITSQDTILHTLPLYHMHGIMNALLCLLNVGGTVVMRPKFDAFEVWDYLTNKGPSIISLFYGVPTMYVMLIEEFFKNSRNKDYVKRNCKANIRLMTSGSAPLPEPVFYGWENITGHFLLERFGMSEIGMALSNPLRGCRIPGSVGNPLPGVEVMIVEDSSSEELLTFLKGNDSHIELSPDCEGKEGELLIRGPTVFKEYWNNEKATLQAFTKCGWFKTGDIATYDATSFKMLGRMSADIIKSGGYKISALPIESHLLSHPEITDCAVFGIQDEKWGERIVALLVTKNKKEFTLSEFKAWCKEALPNYSVPSLIKYVDAIPRNPMGKVNKKELRQIF